MLILNQYQRLGTKTFWVLAIRNSTFGLIIFLIWAIAVGLVLNNTLSSIPFLAQNNLLTLSQQILIIGTVALFFSLDYRLSNRNCRRRNQVLSVSIHDR